MSQGFLGRWSRRKLAPAATPEPAPPQLPAVESLGPDSDFAAFLQQGVAAELQRAALRTAWESDPAISGFRGMAEYAWDFNAPSYGRLRAGEAVGELVRAVLSMPVAEEVGVLPPSPCGRGSAHGTVSPEGTQHHSSEKAFAHPEPLPQPLPQGEGGNDAPLARPRFTPHPDPLPQGGSERAPPRHGGALPC